MARSPVLTVLVVAVVAVLGLRCAFVPSASKAAQVQNQAPERFLQATALSSAVFLASTAPAMAGTPPAAGGEEIDTAEAYNRKVLTGAAYALTLAIFLLGIIISQARKLVENKWLN